MICCKCDRDLASCTCPDLKERFEKIRQFVFFGSDYLKRIEKQIERNEKEQSKVE